MVPRANPVMLDTATSPHARNPTLRSPFTRVIPYAVRKERSNESRQNIEWRRDVIILGPRSAKSGLQTARRTRVAARDQSRRFSNPCPRHGEQLKILSRRGADFTHRFTAIAEVARGLNADDALIDGEAVVLRKDGRSNFGALMTKRGGAQATPSPSTCCDSKATICACARFKRGERRLCGLSRAPTG